MTNNNSRNPYAIHQLTESDLDKLAENHTPLADWPDDELPITDERARQLSAEVRLASDAAKDKATRYVRQLTHSENSPRSARLIGAYEIAGGVGGAPFEELMLAAAKDNPRHRLDWRAWATIVAVLLAVLIFSVSAWGQTTKPATATFAVPHPKVPVLAWDVPVGDMNKWKARGVNVLIGAGMEGKKDQAELDAWAKSAGDRGLWVIVNPLASKPYPNLYAFLLPDELDAKQADPAVAKWDGLRPDQIKPLFDAFRAKDPTVPVFMSLSGAKITSGDRSAYYKSIAPFCDLWMEDGYPRNTNAPRYDESLWPGKACAVLKAAAPDKPLVAMLEVDDQNLWNSPLGRGPTVSEVAEALRQAKANGATGYGVFSHYFSDAGGWAGWDRTPADIAGLLTTEFTKINAPDAGPTLADVAAQLNDVSTRLDALNATVAKLATQTATDNAVFRVGIADALKQAGDAADGVKVLNATIGRGFVPATQPSK